MMEQAISSPSALWDAFLAAVSSHVSAHVLRVWLRPVRCASFDGKVATLEVRDQFFCDWLADHYLAFIRKELTAVARTPVEVRWAINPEMDEAGEDHHDGLEDAHEGEHEQGDGDAEAHANGATQPNGRGAGAHEGDLRSEANDAPRANGREAPGAFLQPDARPGGTDPRSRSTAAGRRNPARGARDGAEAAEARYPGGSRSAQSERDEADAGSGPNQRPHRSPSSPKPRRGIATGSRRAGDKPAASEFGAENQKQLNKRYLFENFVQGPSNQFAFAACHAAAQNPGRSYNPLFIYGGVGLGKTHLLSAIGHHILATNKNAKIIYTSSEQLTNEVINAALSGKLGDFRAKYLSKVDAILVDDIQLIAGKERTQHEFFHIFNALYDSQRQIVVTSDKLPHEIPEIEERLRNRFQWGLIADVQPPEIETRIAILRKKAEVENFDLSNDVAFFLARSIRSNVRELEGALVRIMAHASLNNTPVTIEYARAALSDILQHVPSEVTIESIQKTVAHYFSLRVSELKSSRRQKALVRARQMAMYLCRKHLGSSYPELGSRFGDKDHTTVLASCSRVISGLSTDVNMRMQLDEIEQRMNFDAQQ